MREVLHAFDAFLFQEGLLNNGPITLKNELPQDWNKRLQKLFKGNSLDLSTLGRSDLLKSKLYAYCDRQIDFEDCLALEPSLEELKEAYLWVIQRDANPLWPEHVLLSFKLLSKRRGYEFNS